MDIINSVRSYSTKNVVVFMVVALLLSSLLVAGFFQTSQSSNRNIADTTPTTSPDEFTVNNTVVYGTWSADGSHIMAYDLTTGKESEIANLPVNIKKITVLSDDKLLYIGNTNASDHGTEISIFTLSTQTSEVVYKADNDFGIDDYTLSPNKQFIGVWEVQVNPDSGTVLGGKSRVYTPSLIQSGKNLIYDESSTETTPIRYPLAILNDGKVFTDKFLPNSGAGWAYGMSTADFNGGNKQEVSSMTNGTYGTQPVLSPDGKYLAFAGYSGSHGVGTTVKNGFRQALLTPDTLELLDTSTLNRIKLPQVSSTDIYSAVKWNESENTLVYTLLSKRKNVTGTYVYDPRTQKFSKLKTSGNAFASSLANNTLLTGSLNTSGSSLGNLGDGYASTFSNLSITDSKTGETKPLSSSSSFIQYIGTTSGKYFSSSISDTKVNDKRQVQLQTFYIKPTLEPKRETQQSSPPSGSTRCRDLASAQCNAQLGTNVVVSTAQQAAQHLSATHTDPFSICFKEQFRTNQQQKTCSDSPLYLYGTNGTNVTVKIWTEVFNTTPLYKDEYHVTLGENGTIITNGHSYDSITYDYVPALRRITPPTRGYLVKQSQIKWILSMISKKFGLNEKETADLQDKAQQSLKAPYAFISFFDHETSHLILPLTFKPQPDTYRNIVFYFKNLSELPSYSVAPPLIEPITRRGFTAIEISEIVE